MYRYKETRPDARSMNDDAPAKVSIYFKTQWDALVHPLSIMKQFVSRYGSITSYRAFNCKLMLIVSGEQYKAMKRDADKNVRLFNDANKDILTFEVQKFSDLNFLKSTYRGVHLISNNHTINVTTLLPELDLKAVESAFELEEEPKDLFLTFSSDPLIQDHILSNAVKDGFIDSYEYMEDYQVYELHEEYKETGWIYTMIPKMKNKYVSIEHMNFKFKYNYDDERNENSHKAQLMKQNTPSKNNSTTPVKQVTPQHKQQQQRQPPSTYPASVHNSKTPQKKEKKTSLSSSSDHNNNSNNSVDMKHSNSTQSGNNTWKEVECNNYVPMYPTIESLPLNKQSLNRPYFFTTVFKDDFPGIYKQPELEKNSFYAEDHANIHEFLKKNVELMQNRDELVTLGCDPDVVDTIISDYVLFWICSNSFCPKLSTFDSELICQYLVFPMDQLFHAVISSPLSR